MLSVYKSLISAGLLCLVLQATLHAQVTPANPPYKASLDSLRKITDPILQEAFIKRLEKSYPNDNFNSYKYSIAYRFAEAGYAEKAIYYFKQLQGLSREAALATIPLLIMKTDLKLAEKLVIEELAKSNTPSERQTLLNAQMQLNLKKGDYFKAFQAMKPYYEGVSSKSSTLTAQYYYLMSKSGNHNEALAGLEHAVATGVANKDVSAEFKRAYEILNPGKNSKAYIAALVKPMEDKYQAMLRPQMTSQGSPNFSVLDINGKSVSLADFKGKVVVIDFWATWCGPCIRSFPAMQLVVDKYRDNPDVQFLFIHTWEKVPNPKEDAMKFLADNRLNLPLYMDLRNKETFKNPAVSAFGVKGIPAKFVIDGAGNIRFTVGGFMGTTESAANELSAMIELARKAG